jgi:hypothetical protein
MNMLILLREGYTKKLITSSKTIILEIYYHLLSFIILYFVFIIKEFYD